MTATLTFPLRIWLSSAAPVPQTDIWGWPTDNTGGEVRVTQLLYHFSKTGTFWAERGIFWASCRPSRSQLLRRNTAILSIYLLILARDVLCGNRSINSIEVLKVSIARSTVSQQKIAAQDLAPRRNR